MFNFITQYQGAGVTGRFGDPLQFWLWFPFSKFQSMPPCGAVWSSIPSFNDMWMSWFGTFTANFINFSFWEFYHFLFL
jgi:hypothetical protein